MTFSSSREVAEFILYSYKQLGRSLSISPGFKNEVGEHTRLIDQNMGMVFHVKYSQEHFKSFSRYFPEHGKGEGESIHVDIVKHLKDNDLIFFGGPYGILKIFAGDLRKHGVMRDNERFADQTWSVGIEFCEEYY